MKQFKRDKRIATILTFFGFGLTTTCLLCLSTPALHGWTRFATAALGFAGLLCCITGCHGLGFLTGFDFAIDQLLVKGLIDMERYDRIVQQRQAADQRSAGEAAGGDKR